MLTRLWPVSSVVLGYSCAQARPGGRGPSPMSPLPRRRSTRNWLLAQRLELRDGQTTRERDPAAAVACRNSSLRPPRSAAAHSHRSYRLLDVGRATRAMRSVLETCGPSCVGVMRRSASGRYLAPSARAKEYPARRRPTARSAIPRDLPDATAEKPLTARRRAHPHRRIAGRWSRLPLAARGSASGERGPQRGRAGKPRRSSSRGRRLSSRQNMRRRASRSLTTLAQAPTDAAIRSCADERGRSRSRSAAVRGASHRASRGDTPSFSPAGRAGSLPMAPVARRASSAP
jgi:hypothetical protein